VRVLQGTPVYLFCREIANAVGIIRISRKVKGEKAKGERTGKKGKRIKGETGKREEEHQSFRTLDSRHQTLDSSRPEAERRQLTVMFCDLVGSTALSEQLDPEELREVVRAYQEMCAGVISHYEGHIAQYLGDTPNIAARIQGIAEPDTVVISSATYRLVQGLFECRDLGPQELKGVTTPMLMYRMVGESGAQGRFEVAVSKGLTPLVGREQEAGLLLERWEQVKEGMGQVVMLSGEAGIGKSRLVQVLKEHVAETRQERRSPADAGGNLRLVHRGI
jgi:hypothetical protein